MAISKQSDTTSKPTKPITSFGRFIPWLLIVGGVLGLIAAFIISYDKMRLLQDSTFQPNCNLNPIISCGNIMASAQGSVFGFPNPWIGMIAFGILITIGMGLLAGASFKRWFWVGLQIGTVLGLAFVHWLFFQSVYRIGSLCPYCMVVWAITITTFWYVLLYNLEKRNIVLPAKLAPIGDFIRRHHLDILIAWLLIIFVLIMQHFWYFFGPSLGF